MSKSTFQFCVRAPNASHKVLSFFNDGHILSACPNFRFSIQIDIALANLDLIYKLSNVSGFISQYSMTFTYFLLVFLLLNHLWPIAITQILDDVIENYYSNNIILTPASKNHS